VPVPAAPDVTDPPVGALRGAAPAASGAIAALTATAIVAVAELEPSVAVIVKVVAESVELGVPEIRPVALLKDKPPGRVPPEIV
jgi:energy-converting hydrogenase Eha subunit B